MSGNEQAISTQPLQPITDDAVWKLVASGDLTGLTDPQKTDYYLHLCASLGLNPATQPFEYMRLNNKLVLYAKRTATDQLRTLRGVSVLGEPTITDEGGYITATVAVRDRDGRTDSDIGVVFAGEQKGELRANLRMKALTKAKRRATLSICGLGMLDETEIESIPASRMTRIAVPMIEAEDEDQSLPNSDEDMRQTFPETPPPIPAVSLKAFATLGVSRKDLEEYLQRDLSPGVAIPDAEKEELRAIHANLVAKRTTWAEVVRVKSELLKQHAVTA
jgi:hypothetical protein